MDSAARRWSGQPGRVEVWYATATDRASGTGLWLHHEIVAPVAGEAYAHGWVSVFPPDAEPTTERFGPAPVEVASGSPWFRTPTVVAGRDRLTGSAGRLTWDLDVSSDGATLWTFPRWAWDREVLPAAQVVPLPDATLTGRVTVGDRPIEVEATGNVAHIFGHGNAKRWVWLHADLEPGWLLEMVSAVSRRPGMSNLPPLAFVALRGPDGDWPRDSLLAAPLLRTRVTGDTWTVRGVVGRRRLSVSVTLPPGRSVRLGYTDPDGATATCTNSEVADADVLVERLGPRGWTTERSWTLRGTAHAEIGTRP